MRVPPVDPTKQRPIRKALVEPIARSAVGRWWLIHASPQLDPFLYRISGGRLTSLPMPVLFLTHTGARSGRRSRTPLVYFTDGEDAIVIASNYGLEPTPATAADQRARCPGHIPQSNGETVVVSADRPTPGCLQLTGEPILCVTDSPAS